MNLTAAVLEAAPISAIAACGIRGAVVSGGRGAATFVGILSMFPAAALEFIPSFAVITFAAIVTVLCIAPTVTVDALTFHHAETSGLIARRHEVVFCVVNWAAAGED